MKKAFKIIIPIAVILLIIGGFMVFGKSKNTDIKDYKISEAKIGNFVDYVEADGKISGENEVSIKSKASGNIESILVKNGDKIKKGDIIIKLDTSDIIKNVENARISVSNAKNNLDKITKSADSLSKTQAELALQNSKDNLEKLKLSQKITLEQANDALKNSNDSLKNAYDSALNNIDSAFSGFATIINNSQKELYLSDSIVNQDITGNSDTDKNLIKDPTTIWNVEIPKYWQDISNSTSFDKPEDKLKLDDLAKKATVAYKNAKNDYSQKVLDYRNLSRFSERQDIENFLSSAIDSAKYFTEMQRSINNLYDFWVTYNNDRKRTLYYNIPLYNATLKTDTSSANSYLANLISSQTGTFGINTLKTTLKNSQNNLDTLNQNQPLDLAAAEKSIKAQQESYNKLISGADKLDIRSFQIALQQANVQLETANNQLDNYYIRSPFDGTIGGITLKNSDLINIGSPVAIIVSDQKIVEINVNENDTAKIQIGQKTTVTFDAFDGFVANGEVVEINSTPNSDQSSVVNYKVKISLKNDTDSSKKYFDSVRTGMNVSAKIIIKEKNDILLVESLSVNEKDNGYYVETVKTSVDGKDEITEKDVEIGLIGTDTTEIVSGIDTGEKIIIRQKKKLDTGFNPRG